MNECDYVSVQSFDVVGFSITGIHSEDDSDEPGTVDRQGTILFTPSMAAWGNDLVIGNSDYRTGKGDLMIKKKFPFTSGSNSGVDILGDDLPPVAHYLSN